MKHLPATALVVIGLVGIAGCSGRHAAVICSTPTADGATQTADTSSARPDFSGRARIGKASFYAASFFHRQMADGNRMDPGGLNAASKTLPLGTTARVTNLATGQSTVVQIEDRGPYVKGPDRGSVAGYRAQNRLDAPHRSGASEGRAHHRAATGRHDQGRIGTAPSGLSGHLVAKLRGGG